MESKSGQNIFLSWLLWHFYEMPKFLFSVWRNYILFALNYFSVPLLLKTLFSPWHNYRWKYPSNGLQITEFMNTLISNTFSRFLGALVRVVLIIIGIIYFIITLIIGFLVLLFWILIPFIIIGGIFFSVIY